MATTRASDNFSTRVKIYVLKDQCWEDRGTGICYCRPIDEISSKLMFVVIAEGTESVILSSKISHHSIYQREQGTLLIWAESPEGPNICLSFQAEQGRDEAHQWIMEAQRRLTPPPSSPTEREPSPPVHASLPPLSPDNLGGIIRELENVLRNPYTRESFTSYLFEQNFFSQIENVYNQVSDPPHLLCLQDLYRIIKCLLSINDGRILEAVVRDDFILILAGILENDPDLPGMKLGYRKYLEDASRFRQVIEISSPEILRRIHESFRLSYLKETVLSRSLDESLGSRLAALIGRRNRDVINFMVTHNDYLGRVFNLLDDDETLVSKKRDAILFTQHLCSLAKGEPPALVATLFRILSQKGLLPIFRFASSDTDVKVRVIGIEIVSIVVDYDPSQVRAIINSHPQGQAFLNQLVEAFLAESSASVINQYADMLRSLLILHGSAVNPSFSNLAGADLTGNRRRDPDLDIFVGIFYERYMPRLISPVLLLSEDMLNPTLKLNKKQEASVLAVCELMITFLRAHVERCRFFLLGSDFLIKAGLLLHTPAGHVKLAVLRLYRAGLCSKDQLFHKFLIKKDLFKKVFELYLSTNNANNLINSACLELFDCVLKVDSPALVKYFKDTFNQELYDNRHIRIFEEFFRRTPDTAELSGDTIPLESPGCPRPRDGQADLEEERYFDADDDDEDEESASSGPSDPASPVLPPKRRRSVEEDDEDEAFLILASASKPLKRVPSFQTKHSPALSSPTPRPHHVIPKL
ncbi:Platinum sensitivity protein [Entomophthora muscae]|uniref:Platinum sensitivity protein n=1 Tax=Entomophthora muscae TaxID=34485 RepID=A0ACC2SDV1_9FUNG|nr:Platinum sensitivity protein [Entomophthora muscae]